jgi:hypothetical protein
LLGLLAIFTPAHAQQVFTTDACTAGNSWHYQCGGSWAAPAAVGAFVATCLQPVGTDCPNSVVNGKVNRNWAAVAALTGDELVMFCKGTAAAGRSGCTNNQEFRAASAVFSAAPDPDPEPEPEPDPEPEPEPRIVLDYAYTSHMGGAPGIDMRLSWKFSGDVLECRYFADYETPTVDDAYEHAKTGVLVPCEGEQVQAWQADIQQAVVALGASDGHYMSYQWDIPVWEAQAPECYPTLWPVDGPGFPRFAKTADGFCVAWRCSTISYAATCGTWDEIPDNLTELLKGDRAALDAEWIQRHNGPVSLEKHDLIRSLLSQP